MNIPLSLQLALGFYRGHSRASKISLIHIISIFGISLGVSILIIGSSAMNGFQYELEHRILATVSHIEIKSINPITINQLWSIYNQIEKIPEITSVSFYTDFIGLIESKNKSYPLYIKGMRLIQGMQIVGCPDIVDKNIWQLFKSECQQIILSKGMANILKIQQGDWVTIIVPNNDSTGDKLLLPKRIRLQVLGFFSLSNFFGYNFALIPLQDVQVYLNKDLEQSIEGIAIKVNNIFQVNKVIDKFIKVINNQNIYINSWMHKYGYIYKDIQMIRIIIYLSMLLVILVAYIGMIGVLMISIKEKSRDIAILVTLGAKKFLIKNIFIWHNLLMGLCGILIGVVFGIFISVNLTTLCNKLEYIMGHSLLSDEVYFINFIPSVLLFNDIFYIISVVLLFNLLISLYPASYASHINPAKILR